MKHFRKHCKNNPTLCIRDTIKDVILDNLKEKMDTSSNALVHKSLGARKTVIRELFSKIQQELPRTEICGMISNKRDLKGRGGNDRENKAKCYYSKLATRKTNDDTGRPIEATKQHHASMKAQYSLKNVRHY